ncbi:KTSC domain-containing protein [Rhizobium sp. S96]|jgi:vacuolar-type H+-ATPase subunit E/Vma4|nr:MULTISPECIES: KTSC domain-containing protein [unclassified Rhizobium]MDM9623706.1 KTSC domain-containing protein [Rhizobium sp. S96]
MNTRAIKFAVRTALNSLRREVRALLRKRRDARAATIITRAGREAKMEPLTVKSTLIDAVYFSQEDGRLRVCLSNGQERQFEGVAESEVIAMVTSQSPGQYYLENVRGRFKRIAA